MCSIQNVTRKHGTYYYRKFIGLGLISFSGYVFP